MNDVMYFVEYHRKGYGTVRAWYEDRDEAEEFYKNQKDAVLFSQNSIGFDRILKIKATKNNIKRKYHNYLEWDDYKNGMYRDVDNSEHDKYINLAVQLLSNRKALYYAMKRAYLTWEISAEENLTNTACNRKAWLGWAACCIQYKVPEYLTRKAWNMLDFNIQVEANEIAGIIIDEWEQYYLIKKAQSCQK